MILKTERLILRNIREKDINHLIEGINNIKVSRYLLVVPHPYTKNDAKWWIKECAKKARQRPIKDYNFSIELKSEKKLIGAVGLHNLNRFQGTAEIGYWLGENYWRQGIMYEASRAILDFAFKKLKLRRIDVSVFAENKASNSLVKKLGFRYEGTRIKRCKAKATGKIHDENVYGLLKGDYVKKK